MKETETKNPKVYVKEIYFKNGHKILIKDNQIVVFVGPNNVGKSVVLKEIYKLIQNPEQTSIIVSSVTIEKIGTLESLQNFISSTLKFSVHVPSAYDLDGNMLHPSNIEIYWKSTPGLGEIATIFPGLGEIVTIFAKMLSTSERLQISKPPESIALLKESPKHPVHNLQIDEDLEAKFSSFFKQAFGLDLIVNKGAGKYVPLHVGKAPIPLEGKTVVSKSYLLELEKLPTLESQGDGMRSFVGVLLSSFVASQTILFIDEPEAFLHPPQAYLLGQMISKDLPSDKQFFLSTHSEDFLKGLIEKNSDRIKIVRIQRNGDINLFNELGNDDIKSLWKDPLLKYSNILSALFSYESYIVRK